MRNVRRPTGGLEYTAWQEHQDTCIKGTDGGSAFYLERPVTAGRLDADWNYRLLLSVPGLPFAEQQALMTICKEYEKSKGSTNYQQVINIYGPDRDLVASLHWYGDAKKRLNGKESGTKKFMFDWQGREMVWDSKNTFTGIDHFCSDAGSGEILCYFRSTFLPLNKDGKIVFSPRVKDETARLTFMASCIAYREWAAKRQTGVYLK